jgi:hypothetical protein
MDMNREKLKQAQRVLTQVIADPRTGQSQGEQLRRVKREIKAVMASGKVDGARLHRIVEAIAKAMLDR